MTTESITQLSVINKIGFYTTVYDFIYEYLLEIFLL